MIEDKLKADGINIEDIPPKLKDDNNDDEYNWPIYMLSKTAYLGYITETGYIDEKVVIPHGEPGVPYCFDIRKAFTSVMLCKSEDIPAYVIDDETVIDFYVLVPVTDEEGKLAKEKGSQAVRDMLPNKYIADMERDYLIPSKLSEEKRKFHRG